VSEDLKCWTVYVFGIKAKVFARSRGRARYVVALSLKDVDYVQKIGDAFKKMRVRRAREFDAEACACGKEAIRD
jgi:hypothetical protein